LHRQIPKMVIEYLYPLFLHMVMHLVPLMSGVRSRSDETCVPVRMLSRRYQPQLYHVEGVDVPGAGGGVEGVVARRMYEIPSEAPSLLVPPQVSLALLRQGVEHSPSPAKREVAMLRLEQ
jgi:hypothetical protein